MSANTFNPVAPPGAGATQETAKFSWDDQFQLQSYVALLGLTALLVYSYWNTLQSTAAFWADPQYSHGYLVPFIAIYIAWCMRPNPEAQDPPEGQEEETFFGMVPGWLVLKVGSGIAVAAIVLLKIAKRDGVDGIAGVFGSLAGAALAGWAILVLAYVLIGQPFRKVSPAERWAGLGMLLFAFAARVGAATIYMEPVSRYSFIIAMLGAFLMVGGTSLLRWTGPAIGFLFFMFPLPSVLENTLLLNLQKLAAMASEFVLTILSQPVIRQGNQIVVDGIPLEVAEACSGLRMMTIFGGFAVAVALLIKRPWWDKLIILLSAIPIALIVNVARIVTTALLFRMFPEGEAIHQLIHDYAGLAMMPLAMGLIYLELKVLAALTVEDTGIDMGHGGLGGQGNFGAPPVAGA